MLEYVWIVYEINKEYGKEYLFGVFSSESKQMEACKEFNGEGTPDYRVEMVKLDP